jgi:putative tryptophan/tyrosine transport system substrate-binding protein
VLERLERKKPMKQKSLAQFQSDNPKTKTCTELRRSIQNSKWVMVVVLAVAFVLYGAAAAAQQPGKVFRIGFLDSGTPFGSAVFVDAFRQELTKLGWVEGKNFTIEYRFAEQKRERSPELAADLVRLRVDLIVVTGGGGSTLAAKSATTTIPIVMAAVGDPVSSGLIASLAWPGGNVTGTSSLAPELNTKRLEILKDAVPKLSRVGVLRLSGGGIGQDLQLKELTPAAQVLKLKLQEIETPADAKGLESAFQTAKQKQVGAIMPTSNPRFPPSESGSSSLPSDTGCRLFTTRSSLSMRAA